MKSGTQDYTINQKLLDNACAKVKSRGKEKELLKLVENWNLYNWLQKIYPADYPFIYELHHVDKIPKNQIALLLGRSRERIGQIIQEIEESIERKENRS